jgi:hypothetical protein
LWIVDVSTPARPEDVGFRAFKDDWGNVADVCDVTLDGDYAYLARGYYAALQVLDISVPTNPVDAGIIGPNSSGFNVSVSGNYAYVASGRELQVVDVSDPPRPVEVNYYELNRLYGIVDAAVIGDPSREAEPAYAYVAASSAGLHIVDLAPLDSIEAVGFYESSGNTLGVAALGDYAYIADGGEGLQIVDISDPASSTVVGKQDTPGVARSVAVRVSPSDSNHTYAYVADGTGGLQVIDVSSPSIPVVAGSCKLPGNAQAVVIDETYAYVACGAKGLSIVDISDPSSPVEIGHYGTFGIIQDVVILESYAYLANNEEGLQILDVSDPRNPTEVERYSTLSCSASGIALGQGYAYVACGEVGVGILSIFHPSDPSLVRRPYDAPGDAIAVTVSGEYAYYLSLPMPGGQELNSGEVGIIDPLPIQTRVSEGGPGSPRKAGSHRVSSSSVDIAATEDHLLLVDEEGLQVFDTPGVSRLEAVNVYDTASSSNAVEVADNRAYIMQRDAVQVLDTSRYTHPVEVATFNSSSWGRFFEAEAAALTDENVYVAGGNLWVFDKSVSKSVYTASTYDTLNYAVDVAVRKDRAYVVNKKWLHALQVALEVVDISTPSDLERLGSCDLTGDAMEDANSVELMGNYAYVATEAGLKIVDISNGAKPEVVEVYETPGGASDLAVVVSPSMGAYAYLADGEGDLRVLNLADPVNPREVTSYATSGKATRVVVSEGYAYLADGTEGVRVLDISDPTEPKEVGFYNTPGYAAHTAVVGGEIFVTTGEGGLLILRSHAEEMARLVASPTPSSTPTPMPTSTPTPRPETATPSPAADGGVNVGHITPLGFYDIPEATQSVAVRGDYAYVGSDYGLRIVDIADPTNPAEVGFCETKGPVEDIALSRGYAFVANLVYLDVIDVSDPAHPQRVARSERFGTAKGVFVAGDYAYLATWGAVRIIDITDPGEAHEVGSFTEELAQFTDVIVSDGYAYVSCAKGFSGLYVLDVSNPLRPQKIATFTPSSGHSIAIARSETYLYLLGAGLSILDVSNPRAPRVIGAYDDVPNAWNLSVAGSDVYLVSRDGGLHVIDVADPAQPSEADTLDMPASANGVAVSGDKVYVVSEDGRLAIYRFVGIDT